MDNKTDRLRECDGDRGKSKLQEICEICEWPLTDELLSALGFMCNDMTRISSDLVKWSLYQSRKWWKNIPTDFDGHPHAKKYTSLSLSLSVHTKRGPPWRNDLQNKYPHGSQGPLNRQCVQPQDLYIILRPFCLQRSPLICAPGRVKFVWAAAT